jgi:hypothetical protein
MASISAPNWKSPRGPPSPRSPPRMFPPSAAMRHCSASPTPTSPPKHRRSLPRPSLRLPRPKRNRPLLWQSTAHPPLPRLSRPPNSHRPPLNPPPSSRPVRPAGSSRRSHSPRTASRSRGSVCLGRMRRSPFQAMPFTAPSSRGTTTPVSTARTRSPRGLSLRPPGCVPRRGVRRASGCPGRQSQPGRKSSSSRGCGGRLSCRSPRARGRPIRCRDPRSRPPARRELCPHVLPCFFNPH